MVNQEKVFIQERIAALIYEFGSEIYSFQGLREYKEKFVSKWQPRYTLYSKSSWIVYVMIAYSLSIKKILTNKKNPYLYKSLATSLKFSEVAKL